MPSISPADDAGVCARCAARGPTCCEPEEGVFLALLTPGDLARLVRLTGLSEDEISVVRRLDDAEQRALAEEDPALAGLADEDGQVRSLAKRGRGCVMLEPGRGCRLGPEERPLLCRRFPVLRLGRTYTVRPGGDCLAVEEAADLPQLLTLLGTDLDEIDHIDRRVRADIRRR